MVIVVISLGGTPRPGVSIDGGTAEVENSHEVEGEGTGSRAVSGSRVSGRADRPYIAGKKRLKNDLDTQIRIQSRQLIRNQIQSLQSLKEWINYI